MVKMTTFVLFAVLVAAAVSSSNGQECFGEVDGNIIIQAESTSLSPGWIRTGRVNGYSGSSAIMWNMPNQYNYEGKGKLNYKVCASGGKYKIRGRTSRPPGIGVRGDEANDFYVKIGNSMVKLFSSMGSAMGEWKDFSKFDRNHRKSEPYITLPRGCTEFTVAGRSEYFIVDAIKLVKTGMSMMESYTPSMVPCNGPPSGGGSSAGSGSNDGGGSSGGGNGGTVAKPKCSIRGRSNNLQDKSKLKVQNRAGKDVYVYLVGSRGYLNRIGKVSRGRSKTYWKVRKNAYILIADKKGSCMRQLRVPKSGGFSIRL